MLQQWAQNLSKRNHNSKTEDKWIPNVSSTAFIRPTQAVHKYHFSGLCTRSHRMLCEGTPIYRLVAPRTSSEFPPSSNCTCTCHLKTIYRYYVYIIVLVYTDFKIHTPKIIKSKQTNENENENKQTLSGLKVRIEDSNYEAVSITKFT